MRNIPFDQESQARREMQKLGYPSYKEMLHTIKERGKLPREVVEQVERYYDNKHAKNRYIRKTIAAAIIVVVAFLVIACIPQSRAIAKHFWERCMVFVHNQLVVIHNNQAGDERQSEYVPSDDEIEVPDEAYDSLKDVPTEFNSIEELQQYLNSSITALDYSFAEPVQITYRIKEGNRKTVVIRYETENYGEIMIKQLYDEDKRNLGIYEESCFKIRGDGVGSELIGEISEEDGWFGAYCFIDDYLFGIGIENGERYKEVITQLTYYENQ